MFSCTGCFLHAICWKEEREERGPSSESVFTKYYLHPNYINDKATKKYLVEVEIETSNREQNWRERSFCETVSCNRKRK